MYAPIGVFRFANRGVPHPVSYDSAVSQAKRHAQSSKTPASRQPIPPSHRAQIPIAPAALPPRYLPPRFRALALFERRPHNRGRVLSPRRPKTCTIPDLSGCSNLRSITSLLIISCGEKPDAIVAHTYGELDRKRGNGSPLPHAAPCIATVSISARRKSGDSPRDRHSQRSARG
jgi:hypothetical protein